MVENNNIDLEEMNRQANREGMTNHEMNESYQEHRQRTVQYPNHNKECVFFGTNHQNRIEKQNFKQKSVEMHNFNQPGRLPNVGLIQHQKNIFLDSYNKKILPKLDNYKKNILPKANTINYKPVGFTSITQRITNTGNKFGNTTNVLKDIDNSNKFGKLKPFLKNRKSKFNQSSFKKLF